MAVSVGPGVNRNSDGKDGALVELALDGDLSVVVRDDLFGDRESQSRSRRFGAEHEIEDFGKMFFRNAHAIVLDDDEDILLGSPGDEMDLSLIGDGLDAIDEEVGKGKAELAHIDLEQGQFLLKVGLNPGILHLGLCAEEPDDRIQHVVDLDPFKIWAEEDD